MVIKNDDYKTRQFNITSRLMLISVVIIGIGQY